MCRIHGPLSLDECYVNRAGTTCKRCKKTKEASRRGLDSEAHNQRKRELRAANVEKVRAQAKAHREHNRPQILQKNRGYYLANAASFKEAARAYQLQTKVEVLSHYSSGSPRCRACGESDLRFLALDHLNGGGKAHKREIGGSGGYVYLWARKNGYPPIFQVLCHNCNTRKDSRTGTSRAALQNAALKLRALSLYSGDCPSCSVCLEKDVRVLTFHHVNNDGAEDRRRPGVRSRGFYVHLLSIPKRSDLEIRCQNHNLGERCLGPP